MLEYNPQSDLVLLQRAYVFSAKVHEGQARLSGEPYLIHPLEVAGILVQLHLDDVAITAGLLHDTAEDTPTTPARRRTSARCSSPCPRTSASCSSSSPIACTTCARSSSCPRRRGAARPRRPST